MHDRTTVGVTTPRLAAVWHRRIRAALAPVALAAALLGCSTGSDDPPGSPNPAGAIEASIRSADVVVFAELDGTPVDGVAELDVAEVLHGTAGNPLRVELGEFDAPAGRRTVYVLSGDDPAQVLVDPASGFMTPTRVQRVLDGGTLSAAGATTAELNKALDGAAGVALVAYRPADDGRSAEVLAVDEVLAGSGPEPGDLLEVPDEADWDVGSAQERGHVVLAAAPAGWVVLAEPFGPGVAARLDLSRVGR